MLARNQLAFSTADRLALAAALALFVALALFGQRYHWVEEAGTAERDGYVAQAERLLKGELPRDPYRPPLYVLLTAGLGGALGDPFAAARLISNAAAAALAWLAYRLGRRLAGPAAGGWSMAFVAADPNLWILGQHATTDMLFGALGAGALLAGLAYLEAPGPRPALAAGILLGLAAFTRGNAVFLAPGLALSWWLAPDTTKRRAARLPHLALAAGSAALVLLPHWLLRRAAFGDPFHDENWKNLAWKLHGFPDWSYLDRVPFSGPLELLRRDGGAILAGGLAELARFAAQGLPQLLGTWPHALLFLAGAAYALGRRHRPALWLLAAGFLFLAAAALTFFTWGRLLLPLLPAGYAVAFLPWGDRAGLSSLGGRRARTAATALAAGLLLLLAVKTFGFRLPAFVARHPYAEIATLRRLEEGLPPGARLAGTSPFLGRYLRHGYVAVPDAFGTEVLDPALYLAKLGPLLRRERAAYLVVGAEDLRDRPASLLGPAPPAPWLEPVARARGVAVWRVSNPH